MAKKFVNGKWIGDDPVQEKQIAEAPAKFIDPRDIEPLAPKPPVNDADRPRWVRDNVRYLEELSNYRSRQQFKAEHPELKGKSWHVKESASD